MKPEDLGKTIEYLVEKLFAWFSCIREPARIAASLLDNAESSEAAVRKAMPVWVTSYLLSVLASGWVDQYNGLAENYYVMVASFVLSLASSFLTPFVAYLAMRAYGLAVEFGTVFVAYTIYLTAVTPFYSLMTSGLSQQTYALLKESRQHGTDLLLVLSNIIKIYMGQGKGTLETVSSIGGFIIMPLLMIQGARCFMYIAKYKSLDRAKTLEAGSLGFSAGFFVSLPLAALSFGLAYLAVR